MILRADRAGFYKVLPVAKYANFAIYLKFLEFISILCKTSTLT